MYVQPTLARRIFRAKRIERKNLMKPYYFFVGTQILIAY
ncbi:uncharacterized protein METZ01_LOCUS304115 [marine metagenome]|uniref:Uncharacterized protein n=1 Tax=marine metagenome TaxID=408172 RepID=A0A382MVA8_9ZZZZ